MKLRRWIRDNEIHITEFAKMVGVSRATIHRYMKGDRPGMDAARRIVQLTKGEVGLQDLFSLEEEA